jgi:large subunit ribosomal protein L25
MATSTKTLTLPVERRDRVGTSSAHKLREHGKIPAVLYGHGTAPLHLAVEARAFDDLLHHGGRTNVITLMLDGKKADTAMVREIARHQVTHKIAHIDLQRVSEHEAVHAKVPIVTVGTARGVREFGGVMDVLAHEIDVEGPIDELPDQLEVDVADLGIHQHITASQVTLPKGFKLLTGPDAIIVSVEASKTAQHLEEAASGLTEQTTPEVIGSKDESNA